MTASDIQPGELLVALDTFIADRKLETRGKAIRLLVTEMLMQLGYLTPVDEGADAYAVVYRSSNGDDWLMTTDSAGSISVIHRANTPSGGMVTTIPVQRFLEENGDRPEGQAVRAALEPSPPR